MFLHISKVVTTELILIDIFQIVWFRLTNLNYVKQFLLVYNFILASAHLPRMNIIGLLNLSWTRVLNWYLLLNIIKYLHEVFILNPWININKVHPQHNVISDLSGYHVLCKFNKMCMVIMLIFDLYKYSVM